MQAVLADAKALQSTEVPLTFIESVFLKRLSSRVPFGSLSKMRTVSGSSDAGSIGRESRSCSFRIRNF